MRRATPIDNDGGTFHIYGTALDLRTTIEHVVAANHDHHDNGAAGDNHFTATATAPGLFVSRRCP